MINIQLKTEVSSEVCSLPKASFGFQVFSLPAFVCDACLRVHVHTCVCVCVFVLTCVYQSRACLRDISPLAQAITT